MTEYNNVTNPEHYHKHAVSITHTYEPIDLCRLYCFELGSAIKYIIRYKDKGHPIEDLKKTLQYFDFYLNRDKGDEKEIIKLFRESNPLLATLITSDGNIDVKNIETTQVKIKEMIKKLEK